MSLIRRSMNMEVNIQCKGTKPGLPMFLLAAILASDMCFAAMDLYTILYDIYHTISHKPWNLERTRQNEQSQHIPTHQLVASCSCSVLGALRVNVSQMRSHLPSKWLKHPSISIIYETVDLANFPETILIKQGHISELPNPLFTVYSELVIQAGQTAW